MQRQTTIINAYKDEYVAIVRVDGDRVTLITNADNTHKREDTFIVATNAERLYTAAKEALIAMIPHAPGLIWQEA